MTGAKISTKGISGMRVHSNPPISVSGPNEHPSAGQGCGFELPTVAIRYVSVADPDLQIRGGRAIIETLRYPLHSPQSVLAVVSVVAVRAVVLHILHLLELLHSSADPGEGPRWSAPHPLFFFRPK